MRVLLFLFLLPLGAQNLHVIHLESQDARAMRELWEQKTLAETRWAQAEKYIERKYSTRASTSTAGQAVVSTSDPINGWEYGMEFSPDFEVAAPKLAPPPTPAPSCPGSN